VTIDQLEGLSSPGTALTCLAGHESHTLSVLCTVYLRRELFSCRNLSSNTSPAADSLCLQRQFSFLTLWLFSFLLSWLVHVARTSCLAATALVFDDIRITRLGSLAFWGSAEPGCSRLAHTSCLPKLRALCHGRESSTRLCDHRRHELVGPRCKPCVGYAQTSKKRKTGDRRRHTGMTEKTKK